MNTGILYYQYPFIYFGKFGIKLSLIILMLFLVLSYVLVLSGKKKQLFYYKLRTIKGMPLERNRIIVLVAIYLLIIPLYWFQTITDTSDGFIIDLAERFLKYESLLAILLFVLALGVLLIRKNQYRYIQTVNHAVSILLLISVCFTLVLQQICIKFNILCLFFLGVVFVLLNMCEISPEPRKETDNDYFAPVEKYENLFSQRQVQAEQIAVLIRNSPTKPYSICVSGKWGMGKTSVVNGALEKLNQLEPEKYEIIRINALELDSLQSLLEYVFVQIKRYLKKRGVYVGIGSEYRSFVVSAMGSILNSSISSLIEKKLFPVASDYRDQREQLEELLSKSMDDGRIVIVVDDIERCDIEKAKQFVYFVKEIATMDHCVAIFITDYEHLTKVGDTHDSSKDKNDEYKFYEKFFNYRIDLTEISLKEAMPKLEKQSYLKQTLNYADFNSPSKSFDKIYTRIVHKIEKIKKEDVPRYRRGSNEDEKASQEARAEKIKELGNCRDRFINLLSNPRNLAKFYHAFDGSCIAINNAFPDSQDAIKQERTIEYFKKIRLDEVLFILAYMSVCIPYEAKELKEKGRYYFEKYTTKEEKSDRQLISKIGEDLFFQEPIYGEEYSTNYLQNDVLKFVNTFLKTPERISQCVNQFMKQEEEWFDSIEKEEINVDNSEAWLEMVNAVLRTFFNSDIQKGREYLYKLFTFAEKKIQCSEWKIDDALSFLNHFHRNELWMVGELGTMVEFWKVFGGKDILKTAQPDTISMVNLFSERYVYERMAPVYILLHYYVSSDKVNETSDNQTLKSAYESLLTNRESVESRLNTFLSRVSNISVAPEKCCPNENVFNQLDELADELEFFLKRNGLGEFEDVKKRLFWMRQSNNDIRDFTKLYEQLKKSGQTHSKINIDVVDSQSIQKAIAYFQEAFRDEKFVWDTNVRQNFSDFFEKLKYEPNLELSMEEIKTLHELVSQYLSATGDNTIFYRKVLLDYANTHNICLEG